jgi:transcriptional regulator with XRE-family HTH domain
MTSSRATELGRRLKAERRRRHLSLRDLSDELGISFNTLSRVERGHLPDLRNYQRIVDWLGVPVDTFLDDDADKPDTVELIARHLRTDQRLSPGAADELAGVFADMYTKLVSERPRIAVHMRSAKTFTPAAGTLLAEILTDMQTTLEAEAHR